MPAPSELVIATRAVQRLVKEQSFYRAELVKQEARVKSLQEEVAAAGADVDSNAEYVIRQESRAIDETKAVFAPLKERTAAAVAKLEEQIALSESSGSAPESEMQAAQDALKLGQEAVGSTE